MGKVFRVPVDQDEAFDTLVNEPEKMPAASLAMMMINTAYRYSDRSMTFVEEGVYALILRDLIRKGTRDPDTLAWIALELEGFTPRWIIGGDIRYIGFEQKAPHLSS